MKDKTRQCVVCGKDLVGRQKKCCSLSCAAVLSNKAKGEKAKNWHGGKNISSDGYVRIYMPDHPFACSSGYVYEHRLVFEDYLGRYLKPSEIVHHVNGKKDDNRLENLRLLPNQGIHFRIHQQGRKIA